MATRKITLKKRVGSTYDVLYPEIKKADILRNDESALSTFGASVLDTLVALETGFLGTIYDTNDLAVHQKTYPFTASESRSYFEIAKSDHKHTISAVTGLQTALDAKVPLVGGLIPEVHFPEVNADSLTFRGTLSGASATGNAILLSNFFNLQSNWFTGVYDSNGDVKPNYKGNFKVVAIPGYFTNHDGVTADGKTFNFRFRILNTAFPNFTEVDDYQETNNDLAVQLENGDRIVLTSIVRDGTTYNLLFDVINVNYGLASSGVGNRGTIELSTANSQAAMSGASNSTKVVDEKVMRDSMQDMAELQAFSSNGGDYLNESELSYALTNPTSTTAAAVGTFYLNITTGEVFECTVASPPNYTWVSRSQIYQLGTSTPISFSVIFPNKYYDLGGTLFVDKFATINKTQGTLYALEPVTNDLIFAI
jgi:hypothetical protein